MKLRKYWSLGKAYARDVKIADTDSQNEMVSEEDTTISLHAPVQGEGVDILDQLKSKIPQSGQVLFGGYSGLTQNPKSIHLSKFSIGRGGGILVQLKFKVPQSGQVFIFIEERQGVFWTNSNPSLHWRGWVLDQLPKSGKVFIWGRGLICTNSNNFHL